MSDPAVNRWRARGGVYIWHYRDNVRNYPGWHLTADAEGCTSLLELLTLMLEARYSSQTTITLKEPPAHVAGVANYGSRWYSASSIEIRYPKGQVEPDTWELTVTRGKIRLIMGEANIEAFLESIQDVQNGGGDYCLGPEDDREDMELWFWWYRNSEKDLRHP